MAERIHAIIKGRVQGVFFRSTTKRQADSLKLKGFVKNLENGDVEVVAEGERKNLETLLDWCRKGPAMSNVEKINADWEKASGEFSSFEVKY